MLGKVLGRHTVRIRLPQMSTPPNDRLYSESHEWHKIDGETLTLGLTQFAVDQLTDVTYVEMKKAGSKFKAGDIVGTVESVKTTSDIYCAAAGEVTETNSALNDNPGLLNSDPYGAGWLIRVKVTDKSGLSSLLESAKYAAAH
jgi:glycine cleavage system H protein